MSRKKGYKHTDATRKRISISNTGEKSSQWKGDLAKYQAIHIWIRTHWGSSYKCENIDCEGKSKQYQWALKPNRKYTRNRKDYEMLCRSCHRKQDITEETKRKISLGNRKYLSCKIISCKRSHLAKGYCMNHYNTIFRRNPCFKGGK